MDLVHIIDSFQVLEKRITVYSFNGCVGSISEKIKHTYCGNLVYWVDDLNYVGWELVGWYNVIDGDSGVW